MATPLDRLSRLKASLQSSVIVYLPVPEVFLAQRISKAFQNLLADPEGAVWRSVFIINSDQARVAYLRGQPNAPKAPPSTESKNNASEAKSGTNVNSELKSDTPIATGELIKQPKWKDSLKQLKVTQIDCLSGKHMHFQGIVMEPGQECDFVWSFDLVLSTRQNPKKREPKIVQSQMTAADACVPITGAFVFTLKKAGSAYEKPNEGKSATEWVSGLYCRAKRYVELKGSHCTGHPNLIMTAAYRLTLSPDANSVTGLCYCENRPNPSFSDPIAAVNPTFRFSVLESVQQEFANVLVLKKKDKT